MASTRDFDSSSEAGRLGNFPQSGFDPQQDLEIPSFLVHSRMPLSRDFLVQSFAKASWNSIFDLGRGPCRIDIDLIRSRSRY